MYRVFSMVAVMAVTALLGLAFSLAATKGAGGALSTLGVEQPPAIRTPKTLPKQD